MVWCCLCGCVHIFRVDRRKENPIKCRTCWFFYLVVLGVFPVKIYCYCCHWHCLAWICFICSEYSILGVFFSLSVVSSLCRLTRWMIRWYCFSCRKFRTCASGAHMDFDKNAFVRDWNAAFGYVGWGFYGLISCEVFACEDTMCKFISFFFILLFCENRSNLSDTDSNNTENGGISINEQGTHIFWKFCAEWTMNNCWKKTCSTCHITRMQHY